MIFESSKLNFMRLLATAIVVPFLAWSGTAGTNAAIANAFEPPAVQISADLMGWNDAAVKCKFVLDNYDKLVSKKGANDSQRRQFVMMAIGEEISKRAATGRVTDAEKAWSDFLADEANDRLSAIDAKLDPGAKQVVDELITAVKTGKRPECDPEPPFVLTSEEAADVLEKLKAKVPELAKTYGSQRETDARRNILEELAKQAPAVLAERLKSRAKPPANVSEPQVKTDFALDLAVLRNKLRGHLASDPNVIPPKTSPKPETGKTPEKTQPPKTDPLARLKPYEPYVKQFVRTVLQVPSNRAGLRTADDLKSFISKTIDASVKQFVDGGLTAEESAETGKWADTLTAEHLPLLGQDQVVPPVVILPPVVVQNPILLPLPPFFMNRGCSHNLSRGCLACRPRRDAMVYPARAFLLVR